MADTGYQTIKFEELEQSVSDYSVPADFDWSSVAAQIATLQENWGDDAGYLRLDYRSYDQGPVYVLTAITHVLQNGSVDATAQWETRYSDNDLDTLFDPANAAAQGEVPPPPPPEDDDAVQAAQPRNDHDVPPPPPLPSDSEAPPATFAGCWNDQQWGTRFVDWARDQQMGESVDFLLWLQQSYKPSPSWDWADYIFDTFVDPQAEQAINIDGAVVQAIRRRLPLAGRQRGTPPANAFDDAEAEITQMLAATYARFIAAQRAG